MDISYIEKCADDYKDKINESEQGRLDFFVGLWNVMNDVIKARGNEGAYAMPTLGEVRDLYTSATPLFSQFPPEVKSEQFAAAAKAIADYLVENGGYEDDVIAAVNAVDWVEFVQKQNSEHVRLDVSDLATRIASLVLVLTMFTFYEPITEGVMEAIAGDAMCESHPIMCPVCGSGASISIIDRNEVFAGTGRTLYCSQCGMSWNFDRIRCARCGCTDEELLQFVNIGDAKNHQIQLCDNCGGFIRTTFIDPNLEQVSPIVEDVVSTAIEEVVRAGALQNLEEPEE